MKRRRLAGMVSMAVALLFPTMVLAQAEYPTKPITIIVPFGAGGGTDVQTRVIGQLLRENLGSTVIVENKPGAGSMLATNYVAKANPDGYTLLAITNSAVCSIPVMQKKIEYDPLRDFVGLSLTSTSAFVLAVKANGPIQSVSQLLSQAKANPEKLTFGSAGIGSSPHTLMEILMQQAGIRLTHVPYNSSAAALNDVVGGRVDVSFSDSAAVEMAKSGVLKILAVSTKEPFPPLAGIPPLAQQGVPSYDVLTWIAIVAPSKTPAPVVQKLQAALKQAVSTEKYKEFLRTTGQDNIIFSSGGEINAFFASEVEKWGTALRKANLAGIL